MTAHTPGPWISGPYNAVWPTSDIELRDGKWTELRPEPRIIMIGGSSPEEQANMQLIAAAPDMLATLKSLIPELEDEVERRGDEDDNYDLPLRPALKRVRAVIALAEGREIDHG